MKRAIIRSTLFNLTFYSWTAFACIIFLPGLMLPRKYFLWIVRAWIAGCTFLEETIMNLHYEVRGAEHLPQSGSYIAACKHQSPYETIKLRVLFKDPAIVLKKELLSIPFWGWFLKKSDVIAIDRSTPDQAFASFERGALRMKDHGRPIVIFPQGTRVWPHETIHHKPYRSGVARVQASTGLTIVPMALNSGMFWPRSGWLKSPGTVVFEFLEPIPPGGEKETVMHDLRTRIEEASNKLNEEALTRTPPRNFFLLALLFLLATQVFSLYAQVWLKIWDEIQAIPKYKGVISTQPHMDVNLSPYIKAYIQEITIKSDDGSITFKNLKMNTWVIPLIPVNLEAASVEVHSNKWQEPLAFSNFKGSYTYFWYNDTLKISGAEIRKDDFTARLSGKIKINDGDYPELDLRTELDNYQALLLQLEQLGIIKSKDVFLAAAALGLFSADGVAKIPLTQHGGAIFAGPLQVGSLPALRRPAPGNPPAPAQ